MARLRSILALMLAPLIATGGGMARAQSPLEQAVKATFVGRFPAFVLWPGGRTPDTLCVLGDGAQTQALVRAVATQPGELRSLSVRQVSDAEAGCDILYAPGPGGSPAAALDAARGRPILTVTDGLRGPSRGMIHFVVFEGRVRFHVDAGAAARSGLSINSKLLGLALSVKR